MKTIFFDLETGGLLISDPIIQFAGIAVDDQWKEVEALELKIAVDPGACNPKALEINRWSAERWKAAIPAREAVDKIAGLFGRHADVQLRGARPPHRPYAVARVGGHNVASFDCPRLQTLFKLHNTFLPMQFGGALDTMTGAAWFFERRARTAQQGTDLRMPENFKLTALCAHFGIDTADAHDALADVRMSIALAKVFCA